MPTCQETASVRTTPVTVNNRSRHTLYDMNVRFIDMSGNFPAGFTNDTGFFIVLTTLGPGSQTSMDPCENAGSLKPCQAQRVEWTYRIKHGDTDVVYNGSGATDPIPADEYWPDIIITQDNFVEAAAESSIKSELKSSSKRRKKINPSEPR